MQSENVVELRSTVFISVEHEAKILLGLSKKVWLGVDVVYTIFLSVAGCLWLLPQVSGGLNGDVEPLYKNKVV